KILLARETRQPYPSSCGISFSLRELWRVNNALICHPITPSPTFGYCSGKAGPGSFFDLFARARFLARHWRGVAAKHLGSLRHCPI
ncbi:MAG: hypothetical protein JJU19_01450, partial [Pararhodobacter sp.]|nr:hypothetical protein [Pararhodobacter sp.]